MRLMEEPQQARVVAFRDLIELPSPSHLELVGGCAVYPVGLVEIKHGPMLWC